MPVGPTSPRRAEIFETCGRDDVVTVGLRSPFWRFHTRKVDDADEAGQRKCVRETVGFPAFAARERLDRFRSVKRFNRALRIGTALPFWARAVVWSGSERGREGAAPWGSLRRRTRALRPLPRYRRADEPRATMTSPARRCRRTRTPEHRSNRGRR